MGHMVTREMVRKANADLKGDDHVQKLTESVRRFVQDFAKRLSAERHFRIQISQTANAIEESGTSAQKNRLTYLKADMEDFLTATFSSANLAGCNLIEQNRQLTLALLKQYPLMDKPIAQLEAQRFCYYKAPHLQ